MGLCKCPKKKVTNIFCFEHRVNVCEHCLVTNHPRCIVRSYLQWLQDSDYNPNCTLCGHSLAEGGECVRLVCHDVFHWTCLNKHAQTLPQNTAPAGYTCPLCSAAIFPPINMVSPVVEGLKDMLSKVNWARAGLGMPLIEEAELCQQNGEEEKESLSFYNNNNATSQIVQQSSETPLRTEAMLTSPTLANLSTLGTSPSPNASRLSAQVNPYTSTPVKSSQSSHSIINVDTGTTVRALEKAQSSMPDPRKLFDSTKEDLQNLSRDHDEDKYKRRSAFDWLSRWLRSREPKKGYKKDHNAVRKRFFLLIGFAILAFITMIVIFSALGRRATEDDPFLDPRFNPNIRSQDTE
ncbi:hypothetical protein CHS0354_042590 [Potamilus streckersoni]|uniref:RING-type domain-containing protein n=1 Tax=Potamilus streckersoni TaxID=2493646 RepID=A0AAE0WCK8_9BIVA|nr:hypothetical protein CHS0354_042590 [Potamilus streckersoni]